MSGIEASTPTVLAIEGRLDARLFDAEHTDDQGPSSLRHSRLCCTGSSRVTRLSQG